MPSVQTSPPRDSRSEPRGRGRTLSKGVKIALVASSIGLIALLGVSLSQHWKEISSLVAPLESGASDTVRIYDRYDHLVCTICGTEDRVPVSLNQVSPNMKHAVIAAEDHDFYQHHGINPESIARAAFVDVKSGHVVEGGSTITQQLAKILYSKGLNRTLGQKFKEAIIAWQLESRYSKDTILEAYLNQVYFGRGAYGIQRASELFFGKSASKLSLSESAFIAGLINSPSHLSLPENKSAALIRQSLILDEMTELGFVSKTQALDAKQEKIAIRGATISDSFYLYYTDAVLSQIASIYDSEKRSKNGLSVYTNMDQSAQRLAVASLNKGILHAPKGVSQAALVSICTKDGTVEALVGGAGDYWKHQYNRATNPHTVGSSFKPFVYLAGILSGVITPHTVLVDEPITITQPNSRPYSPRNFDHQFKGPITVREALSTSRNVCAVKVAVQTGLDKVISVATRAGISVPLDPQPSLALGSCAVSPLEMASAYSTFARGGIRIEPELIRAVKDFKGNVLLSDHPRATQVFDSEAVAELVDMLQDVVRSGTATAAQLSGRPVAGKTGTADQAKDLWFVGFTPDMVTATWGGNDENLAIAGSRVTGGSVMAGIWHDYMVSYYKTHPTPPGEFAPPATPMDRNISEMPMVATEPLEQIGRAVENGERQILNQAPHGKKGVVSSIGHFFKSLFH